jgi:hypothetical protein
MPPYTPFVPDYYSAFQEKLKVTLVSTDMQHPALSVRMRMRISSSSFAIENPAYVYTPVFQLSAGEPVSFSMQDLEFYFRPSNIRVNGNLSEFNRSNMLPDGFYRFHFEVYESVTDKLLNNPNTGYAQAMIASGDPPRLNMPEKGAVIQESSLTNILFSWTPRHMSSLAAAYGTDYEFSMVELYDKQMPPEGAFQYARPFFSETLRPASFIYSAAHPLLIPGRRYAWRVRAVARDGMQQEMTVFKNSGYSEVFYFDYAADCPPVRCWAPSSKKGG